MAGVLGLVVVAACSAKASPPSSSPDLPAPAVDPGPGTGLLPPDTVDPGGTGPQYPGTGFRVHEWGTNTIVVGSDGSMQRGLQHEEEDLPAFVYDRRREELASPVDVKMETPVTYFYSDKLLSADVSVSFPDGVLSQWYPAVQSFYPPTFKDRGDPVLDTKYPYSSPSCRERLSRVENGLLQWGAIEILPRGGTTAALQAAPLDRFTWSHARAVDANQLRVRAAQGSQDERFLFYRGLGNFPLDVKIAAQAGPEGHDGGLVITNRDAAQKVGAVFVLRVEKEKAAFVMKASGIAPNGALDETAPPATQSLESYSQDLANAMVGELDKAGLYHDESVAMVKTWARQWFRTPGVRVLYLAPQAWTDKQIPLSISPAPQELVRAMVIRVEVLTPALEEVDVAAFTKLATADEAARTDGEAHFRGLGRFAEPRLRRARDRFTQSPAGADWDPTASARLLDGIAGADVRGRAGE